MAKWVKAIGIDFGRARIGISASDDIGMLAHPLETVPASDLDRAVERIMEVVNDRSVRDVVVGLPLRVSGEEGTAVEGVRDFVRELKKSLPASVMFHEVDERYTTQMAMEKLHQVGRTAKDSKGIIDQAAAVEILQRWLDLREEPASPDD
ncbi:MAG: Holliday junction resolvase RuvX [Verrucomicrobiales bacterium]|nr:Holliday junction resolvase RuvX [Verrucomicrobiales bacterium]